MSFTKSALTLSISTIISTSIWAESATVSDQDKNIKQLETITITAHPLDPSVDDFGVADQIVSREKLQQGGSTLGEALKNELGVYSNSFGAGSSRQSFVDRKVHE